MKRLFSTSAILLILSVSCAPKKSLVKADPHLLEIIDNSLRQAVGRYKYMKSLTDEDRFPKNYEHGRLVTSSARNWTSGFYPGTLCYLYEYSQDKELLHEVENKLTSLESQKDNKRTHDLGFMMYCSFGNAYRLTQHEKYKDILVQSARSLASRYNPKVGSIQSWDRIKSFVSDEYWAFPVIIDNMMNLELLFFASKSTGDARFKDMAVKHAETAMKNHVRPDYSSYHVVAYNPETGAVESRQTYQGFAHNSTWARGQGWGIYGFTMVYRETGDDRFLKTAQGMADFFLNHENLPEDKIPYWDFNAGQPNFPSSWAYDASKYSIIPRDASAGALVASALIELSSYSDKEKANKYLHAAEAMIKSLASPAYTSPLKENGGFILMHSVGNLTKEREVDVPLSYADYYYTEAMLRYKNLPK